MKLLLNKSTPYHSLKQHLQTNIPNARDKALFATQYAGYARIGEIVRGRFGNNPPLTFHDLNLTEKHLDIQIKTEKTQKARQVTVSRRKENWLVNLVWAYAKRNPEMFSISTAWSQKLFHKYFKTPEDSKDTTHWFRHLAVTHGVQGFKTVEPLTVYQVSVLGGWESPETMLEVYSELRTQDFKERI